MATKPIRVAIYLRVSKEDQDPQNQLLQLREFCRRWEGHELVAEYVDRESGTRGRRERKDFDRMFADAARRRFDVLLFWALDRFSREGIRKTIANLERLDADGGDAKPMRLVGTKTFGSGVVGLTYRPAAATNRFRRRDMKLLLTSV